MVIHLEDLLLFRIILTILDFFVFPYEVEYCPVKVHKELWRNFYDCIESVDWFWQDGYFYYVNSTNPQSREIFPFYDIFLNFFLQILDISVIHVFHFLGKSYHPKIFHIIWGKDIVFLISLSVNLPFVYRRAIDFILIFLFNLVSSNFSENVSQL